MKPQPRLHRLAAFALAMAVGPQVASAAPATSNYWQDTGGNYNGTYTDTAHWDTGVVPTQTNSYLFFTNAQTSSYTVQLTDVTTSGVVRVSTDNLTFDVNGYKWYARPIAAADYAGANPNVSHTFGRYLGETATVVFSSSSISAVSGGNTVDLGQTIYGTVRVGGWNPAAYLTAVRGSTLRVDDSLGNSVTVISPYDTMIVGGSLIVSGTGSEFRNPVCAFCEFNGDVQILNGGFLNLGGGAIFGSYFAAVPGTNLINDATLYTGGNVTIGWGQANATIITNNGLWLARGKVRVGDNPVFGTGLGLPYRGNLIITDNSQLLHSNTNGFEIGSDTFPNGIGRVDILNNSSLVISNGSMLVRFGTAAFGGVTRTNTLLLDSTSEIVFGDATHTGALTNRGVFFAGGLVKGQGPDNFLLQNEGRLEPGNSIGTLSIENGDFNQAANGVTIFEFDSGNLADLITISNGVATVGGTNLFVGFNGYTPGLQDYATWEFMRADDIVYTASDNIDEMMAGLGFAPEGYFFGVINDGFQDILILQIPEPSSLGLLAFGAGLWFLRRRRLQS